MHKYTLVIHSVQHPMCFEYVETSGLRACEKTRVLSPLLSFLRRLWDYTSFLNLSSKCATSPVSCCWDSVVAGGGGGNIGPKGGVEIGEKRGER